MSGRGHQLIHSDALSAELEALGLDSSLFGAAGIPAPIFQALVPRRAGVFDEHANTFGAGDEPAIYSRGSLGRYRDATGAWASAAANTLRADHDPSGNFLGYLFEPSTTNDFLNSTAPATQDIALGTGTFTCSVHGTGSVTSSDGTGTASGHGAATDGAPNTIVVSSAGTITYTVSGTPAHVSVEGEPVATSPIDTGASPATRSIDSSIRFDSGLGGIDLSQGMACVDVLFDHDAGGLASNTRSGLLSVANDRLSLLSINQNNAGAGNSVQFMMSHSGTNASKTLAYSANDALRVFAYWGHGGNCRIGTKRNGAFSWGTARAFGTITDGSVFHIGYQVPTPIRIKRVIVWNKTIAESEIERLLV